MRLSLSSLRSLHTLGDEFMNTTKTKLRQRITVPPEVMDVLRWHVATQLTTPEQKASELLFPAEDGGFRSVSFLKKAFATVAQLIGLKKTFTPRGMRRTFNDLMRLAKVEAHRHQVDLRPPDRPHARALLDGHPRRAATEHRQRCVQPLVTVGPPPKVGRAVGRVPGEWGGSAKSPRRAERRGPVFPLFLVGAIGFEPTTPTVSRSIWDVRARF